PAKRILRHGGDPARRDPGCARPRAVRGSRARPGPRWPGGGVRAQSDVALPLALARAWPARGRAAVAATHAAPGRAAAGGRVRGHRPALGTRTWAPAPERRRPARGLPGPRREAQPAPDAG